MSQTYLPPGLGLQRALARISPDGHIYFKQHVQKLIIAHKHKARLQFLKICILELVLPRSIPKGDNVFGHPFPKQQPIMLSERILAQHLQLGERFDESVSSRKAYQAFLPPHQFGTLAAVAKAEVDKLILRVKLDLDKKS